MTATLQQTQQDLGPYITRLEASIRRALARYQEKIGGLAVDHTKRSTASLIHDYMVVEIKAEFEGEPGIPSSTRSGAD